MLFLSFSMHLFSQSSYIPGNPLIRNFLSEDYNAYIQNWNIVQDNRGVTYFANGSGVLEYDGRNWNLFKLKNESGVFSVALDKGGRLYAGGIGDFGYFEIDEMGRRIYISLIEKIPIEFRNITTVWRINITSEGVYFTTRALIYHYHNNKIDIIHKHAGSLSYTVYDEVFINDSVGMTVVKNKTTKLLPQTADLNSNGNSHVHALPFGKGKLLFASRRQGLFIYDYNKLCKDGKLVNNFTTLEVEPNILRKFPTEADNYLKKYSIYTCCQINDSTYAFGTLGGGIVIINSSGNLIKIINENRGLINNMVYYLYVDNLENLWVATDNGVSYIQLNSAFTYFDKRHGLKEGVINIIAHKRKLYCGTFNFCYYLSDYKLGGESEKYSFIPIFNETMSTSKIVNDKLFVGGRNLHQIINNESKKLFETADVIYSIDGSSKFKNRLFLGLRHGFESIKLEPENRSKPSKWQKVSNNGRVVFKELNYSIRDVNGDEYGNLWLTSELNGVFYLKFLSNTLQQYQLFHFDTVNGLPSNKNNRIFLNKGKVFVTTSNGIYEPSINNLQNKQLNQNISFAPSEVFKAIPKDFGPIINLEFVGNKVYCITSNNSGVLITKNGHQEWNTILFKDMRADFENFVIGEDSIIWYSTNYGIYRYDSKKEKILNSNYTALIRKVFVNADSLIFFGNYVCDSINVFPSQKENQIPILEYKNNNITFEYSTPFFEHGDKLVYQYLLEGFDNAYSEWNSETKKEYTNLPEGTYCFKVRAKNIYNVESIVANYKFIIETPWYRTILAYATYLLLLIGLVYSLVKFYASRLEIDKKNLEEVVKERTLEIQARNQEIQQQNEEIRAQTEELYSVNEHLVEMDHFKEGMTGMIVHDLKNPLSTILGISEKPEVKQAGKQMLNMVMNILDIQKFENAEMKLQLTNNCLLTVINKAVADVQMLLDKKSLHLDNLILPELFIKADVDIIIRVFVNLLTNAIKYTPNNGKITLNTNSLKNSSFVNFSITDTGQGIEKNKLRIVFDKFSQVKARNSGFVRSTGLGLSFCKLAINAHGGKIGVESEQGIGTTFKLQMPKGTKTDPNSKVSDSNRGFGGTAKFILEPHEISYLSPFCERLKEFTVYEYSDLIYILNEIDIKESHSIQMWKQTLENSIRACNEEKFNDLTKMNSNE